jgi:hypothetical protein
VLRAQGYPAEGLQETKFRLPCPLLVERKCSVYPHRPAVCGRFRCEVLKAADAGAMTLDQALGHVRQAHTLLARLREVMPEGVSLEQARARWKAVDFEPGSIDPAEAAGYFAFYAYYRYMDRHFRRPAKWLVTPKPEVMEGGEPGDSNDVA